VKPVSDPKTPFKSEHDYTAALEAHHKVMLCAVKCKQTVDPANADALEAAAAHATEAGGPTPQLPHELRRRRADD